MSTYFILSILAPNTIVFISIYVGALLLAVIGYFMYRAKHTPKESKLARRCIIGSFCLLIIPVVSMVASDETSKIDRIWDKIYAEEYMAAWEDFVINFHNETKENGKYYDDCELCYALWNHQIGSMDSAHWAMSRVDGNHFRGKRRDFYQEKLELIEKDYAIYVKKREALEAEKIAQEKKKPKKIDLPYVGMSESMISKTSLGAPRDKVRHNTEMINGNVYHANLYDFVKNGKCIFTARCINGTVTQVWDMRDDPQTFIFNETYYPPEINVDDFKDPEDFYDEYHDDFLSYEDAEDYYYAHGGK